MGTPNPTRDPSRRDIRLGSRGSALALWQAGQAADALQAHYPELNVATVVVKTSGDRDQSTPLDQLPHPGYFTKELEASLLAGAIDVAVHSLKDMAAKVGEPFQVAAILPRGPAGDVLVLHPRHADEQALPPKPAILTGSVRRAQQLRTLYPGCRALPVRGNIHTRLRKLGEQQVDALVMAAAALDRLGIAGYTTVALPLDKMIPAPGQGAIALETLADRADLTALLNPLDSPAARRATDMERHFAYLLEGGCSLPLGAHAWVDSGGGAMVFLASLGPDSDALPVYQRMEVSAGDDPLEAAAMMANRFKNIETRV